MKMPPRSWLFHFLVAGRISAPLKAETSGLASELYGLLEASFD
jgi:hypothetical protein